MSVSRCSPKGELTHGWPCEPDAGLCVDHVNQVVVCEPANRRVRICKADGSLVTSFGGQGICPGQSMKPSGVCVDDGRLAVVD